MKRFSRYAAALAAVVALGWSGASLAFQPSLTAPPNEQAPVPDRPAPAPDQTEAQAEGYEALAHGPLHEAFANPYSINPEPSVVVSEAPPEPIAEIPPDEMPNGDNVAWISGYWGWDPSEEEFIWISGLWREVPADRRWVPGYWMEADGGYQWIAGFWTTTDIEQITYLPEPPPSQERGPNVAPPSQDSVWMPGVWAWEQTDYQWQPGYWGPAVEGWVWVPDQYVWTPHGCIFVPGYWDRTFDQRGVMFAPVVYHEPIYTQPNYVYTPTVVVYSEPLLIHLFASPGHHHYYYGDYYGYRPGDAGFYPWYTYATNNRAYDPLFNYYSWSYGRRNIDLGRRLSSWNTYFVQEERFRPRRTYRAQREFVATLQGADVAVDVGAVVLTDTLQNFTQSRDVGYRFHRVADEQRDSYREISRQRRDFQRQRRDFERSVADNSAEQAPTERRSLQLPERSPIEQQIAEQAQADQPQTPEEGTPRPDQPEQEAAPGRRDRGRRGQGPPERPRPISPTEGGQQDPEGRADDSQDTPQRPGMSDRPDIPPQAGQPGAPNPPDQPEAPGQAERPDRPGRGDQPSPPGRPDSPGARPGDQPGAPEAPNQPETPDSPERGEMQDRPSQPEQPGQAEQPPRERPNFPRFGVSPRNDSGRGDQGQPGADRGAPGAGRPEARPRDGNRGGMRSGPFDRLPPGGELLNHPIGQINRMLVLQCQIAVPLHNDREPPVRAVICLVPVAQAVKTRAPINRAPTRVYPTPMRNVRVVEMRDRDPRGRPLRPGKLGGRNAIPSVDRTVANVNGLEARTGTNKL